MRNPAALTAAVIVLLAAGFGAGLLVGERRRVEERRPGPESGDGARTADPVGPARAPSMPRGKSADLATAVENSQLRDRVRVLEVELQTLRDRTATTPAKAGGDAVAEQVYEDFLAIEKGGVDDPERLRSFLAGLPQLDAASAKYFIDRYRKLGAEPEKQAERFMAVQLALFSGGPEATQFLQTLLRDQSLDLGLRNQILGEVGTSGVGIFSIRRLPVDESLGSTAMTLVRSEKVEERRAGAGLLGGVGTPGSRLELERMLTQDSDAAVKTVAARSLGLVGDPSSRKLLEPLAADGKNPGLQRAAAAAIKQLDQTPR